MQRDRPADRRAGERDLLADAESVEQRDEIVRHRVDRERTADFLREARAARVVAHDTPLGGEDLRDETPAFHAAAHLVDQHNGLAGALDGVAQ